eukprot:tig00021589_g22711.t1
MIGLFRRLEEEGETAVLAEDCPIRELIVKNADPLFGRGCAQLPRLLLDKQLPRIPKNHQHPLSRLALFCSDVP